MHTSADSPAVAQVTELASGYSCQDTGLASVVAQTSQPLRKYSRLAYLVHLENCIRTDTFEQA